MFVKKNQDCDSVRKAIAPQYDVEMNDDIMEVEVHVFRYGFQWG